MITKRPISRSMRPIGLLLVAYAVLIPSLAAAAGPKLDLSPLPGNKNLAEAFVKYYKPVKEDAEVRMPSYKLPLDLKAVTNLAKIEKLYLTKKADKQMLIRNGFVVIEGGWMDDITQPYKRLRAQDLPIYVSADTLLHLFHIQFDETLKEIEEKVFYPDIVAATKVMLKSSERDYESAKGLVKEAAKRNVAYFSVALKQFEPDFKPPKYVSGWVDWECKKIEEHEGLPKAESPYESGYETARAKSLFRIPEDYSQYKPRGHYTRSDILKKYFRGMMWYGRMTFLMKGHEEFGQICPPCKALTDRETAKIQTIQAAVIAARCGELELPDGRKVADVWDRIYSVTAFYAGLADDLTLYDYRRAVRGVFGKQFSAAGLLQEPKFNRLLLELTKLRKPGIFSGTGGAGLDPGQVKGGISVKELDRILGITQGFRFMGQRYIPDSYMLGQLVSPAVGRVTQPMPISFTTVRIHDERIQPHMYYTIRGFPRGLDVMAVLGSKRAEKHVVDAKDHRYPLYTKQLEKLRKEFGAVEQKDWNRNLYWSWLYCLKTLAEPRSKGYQSYQQTDAWTDRQLNSALASWASLRHDTILYAKQSYTPIHIGIISVQPPRPLPPPPKGLVEPLPEFFARMLATAQMAQRGLKDLEVAKGPAAERLTALVAILEKLYDLCKRQVANKALTVADNRFLADFPDALKGTIGKVDEKGLKTTLIADVHTDLNSGKCLEEGSGHVDYIVVAYRRAEGDVVLAVGPVLSYYEFKHPMKDRLTDEQWRKMLKSDKAPKRPTWNKSYTNLTK